MTLRFQTGVGFPSYGNDAVLTPVASDSWGGSLPNLAQNAQLRLVGVNVGVANFSFKAVLPAAQQVQLAALVNHDAPVGATFRLQFFSDTNPDPIGNAANMVFDSGVADFWPDGSGPGSFFPTRPYLIPAPLTVRSVLVTISNATARTWEFGAFELAGWWAWPATSQARKAGINSRASRQEQPDNIDIVVAQWAPRVVSLTREMIAADEINTKVLDFQNAHGLWRPFVFVDDIGAPETWRRACFMARNASLPTTPKNGFGDGQDYGDFSASIVEHL